MKTQVKKSSIVAASTTALLFIAVVGLVMYDHANKSLQSDLDGVKLKSESLLSEKLSISKEIEKLRNDMTSLKGKNSELDKYLNSARKSLSQKEAEINSLKKENANVKSLQKQLSSIQAMRRDLENQLAQLTASQEKRSELEENQSAMIEGLKSENEILAENTKILSALVAQNYRVESMKGKKDRLTVNSKATKKIVVGFDIPQNVAEEINFKITTPEGKLYSSEDRGKNITSSYINVGQDLEKSDFLVSLAPGISEFDVSKRIEMSYKPKEKLVGGVYKIDIYNRDVKLGSCQIRLK